MSKLMELPDVKINTSRSGFDMSSRLLFSSKAGEMLPVFVQEVIPSNKKKITFQWFTRTQPLDTAAYTRLREYVDFYFVPYDQLWKQWRSFALQMNDNAIYASDINRQQSVSDKHPYFTVKQVADFIYKISNQMDDEVKQNCLGFARGPLACKLLEYLGYGDFTPYLTKQYESPDDETSTSRENMINVPLNPFPLLAYQKIYQDKIRNTQWEKSAPYTYNLDYIKGDNDLQIPVESIDITSRVSMFELQYMNWNKDYYMGLLPNSQYGDEAVVPLTPNRTSDLPLSLSFSTKAPTGSASSLRSSPVYSNFVASPPLPGENDFTLTGPLAIQSESNDFYDLKAQGILDPEYIQSAISGLSILLLRQYEMLQKYREVQQSAPTDYKSQIEKLFGVSLSWHDSNQVRWLGGVSRNIEINDIVNTNLDSDTAKATIHGKGVGVGDGSVEFDTNGDYGLIIGIYHVRPILEYSLSAPYKLNTKFRFSDYAQPAFDRIGLQSVTAGELFNSPHLIKYLMDRGQLEPDRFLSLVLGYGPRYLDYKTQVDRVVGIFKTSEKSWCTPISDEYIGNMLHRTINFANNLPVAINSTDLFNYSVFKINPSLLDPIFAVAVEEPGGVIGAADSTVDTDQFISNIYFKVDDVKNLDYDGMPY